MKLNVVIDTTGCGLVWRRTIGKGTTLVLGHAVCKILQGKV